MSAEQAEKLAKTINSSLHTNPLVTLLGVAKYVNSETQPNDSTVKRIKLKDCAIGAVSTGNKKVDDAIRVLRLIHINQQKTLQSKINETLSKFQKITGDPKTDLKIGRVGR